MRQRNVSVLTVAMLIVAMSGVATAQLKNSNKQQAAARPTRAVPEPPSTKPNADYPLKVHILTGEAATISGSSVGVGSANVTSEGKTLGFDYTFECDAAIGKNSSDDEFYQGKWKKKDSEMEVLSQGDADKVHKCKMKVGMREFAYDDDTHKPPPLPAVQRGGGKKKQ